MIHSAHIERNLLIKTVQQAKAHLIESARSVCV